MKKPKTAGDQTATVKDYYQRNHSVVLSSSLEDSEERLRLALEAADIAIWDWNLETNQITFSDNFEKLLGKKPGTFDGRYSTFLQIVHPQDRKQVSKSLRDSINKKQYYDVEFRIIWPENEMRWMRIRGNVYQDKSGKTNRLMGSLHDKTERKLALEDLEKRVRERTAELLETNERLRAEIAERKTLQKEIMEISEREQQRIGQDLHDSLSQQIGGIVFMTQALSERLDIAEPAELEEMQNIIKHLNNALKHTRDLSRGLYPIIGEGRLNIALKDLAQSLQDLYGITIRVTYDENIGTFDSSSAVHLFRIVQESINNSIKHGRANRIDICMKQDKNEFCLTIEDNGAGFPQNPNIKGIGLNIMKYRASIIGASFEIESDKGTGTRIKVLGKRTNRLDTDFTDE